MEITSNSPQAKQLLSSILQQPKPELSLPEVKRGHIDINTTMRNLHEQIEQYNADKLLKDQIRCFQRAAIIRCYLIFIDLYNSGDNRSIVIREEEGVKRFYLSTNNEAIATQIGSDDRTVGRIFKDFQKGGKHASAKLIYKPEEKLSRWYNYTLLLNQQFFAYR